MLDKSLVSASSALAGEPATNKSSNPAPPCPRQHLDPGPASLPPPPPHTSRRYFTVYSSSGLCSLHYVCWWEVRRMVYILYVFVPDDTGGKVRVCDDLGPASLPRWTIGEAASQRAPAGQNL